jgi:hypothetical protein
MAALATMTANGVRQFAKHRREVREARDERARQAAEKESKAAFDEARSLWAPAHDRDWLARADLLQTARAWSAAVPYAEDDTAARSAMRKCEQRLRDLHPHGMDHYDRLRDSGHAPEDAMREAAPFFARDPNVRPGHASTQEALEKAVSLVPALPSLLPHSTQPQRTECESKTASPRLSCTGIRHRRLGGCYGVGRSTR